MDSPSSSWLRQGPIGTERGDRFDELELARKLGPLTGLRVYHGDGIHDIVASYGGQMVGTHVPLAKGANYTDIPIDVDDPIVGLGGQTNDGWIFELSFLTASGKAYGPLGSSALKGSRPFRTQLPDHAVPRALFGTVVESKAGSVLSSFGFHTEIVEPPATKRATKVTKKTAHKRPPPMQQQAVFDEAVVDEAIEAAVEEAANTNASPPAGPPVTPMPPPAHPSTAGYLSDVVDGSAPDRLDIQHEVEALARVIASRQVKPPLSLGLFGDWGSGKSFFMAKMGRYVERLTAAARAQPDAAVYCSRVVQIQFNAWHFADANLWASLVQHIFDRLFEAIGARADGLDEQLRRELVLTRDFEAATTQVKQAQEQLDAATAKVAAMSSDVEAPVPDLAALMAKSELGERLERVRDELGIDRALESAAALQQRIESLGTLGRRAWATYKLLLRSPWTRVLLPVLAISLALPYAVEALMTYFPEAFTWTSDGVMKLGSGIAAAAAWLGTVGKQAAGYVTQVEDALAKAKAKRDELEQEHQRKLSEHQSALAEQQAASERLAAATVRRDLSQGLALARLIEARSDETSYRRHLGIISLVRQDFEQLSAILSSSLEAPDRDGGDRDGDDPPIQRIILYIDDLDRCRPQRVVEVLEAIHLLLSFPLFVVVVAVDPRWLRRCLEAHYPELLGSGHTATNERLSTPQDYLEKIFQIPFALRRIDGEGFRGMMEDLMRPMPEPSGAAAPGSSSGPAPTIEAQANANVPAASPPKPAAVAAPDQRPSVSASAEPAAREQDDELELAALVGSARPLTFTDSEQRDILRLAPLFRAPRSVKRFVNIYRLVRVGLMPDELPRFLGDEQQPGEYRVALVLLAIITAYPNQASRFLNRLDWWLPRPLERGRLSSWDDFVRTLSLPEDQLDDWVERIADETATEPRADEPGWVELCELLAEVTQLPDPASPDRRVSFLPFEEAVLGKWARRVARYSFSLSLSARLGVRPSQA